MRQMRILFRRKRVSRSCKSVLRKRSRHRYCLMKSPIRRLTCQSQPTLNRPSTWKSRPFRLRGGQRPSIERRNRPRSGRPTLTPASPVAQHPSFDRRRRNRPNRPSFGIRPRTAPGPFASRVAPTRWRPPMRRSPTSRAALRRPSPDCTVLVFREKIPAS